MELSTFNVQDPVGVNKGTKDIIFDLVPKPTDKKDSVQKSNANPNTLELIKPVLGVTIKNANTVIKGPEGDFENMSIAQ